MALESPINLRRKLLSAPLSSELRERHGTRSFPIREGDTVRIVRGDFSGVEGKVSEVNLTRRRIFIEGVTREKVSGTSTKVSVHPSKVIITNMNLSDKLRADSLGRRKASSERAQA